MDNDRPLAQRVARLEADLAQLTSRYERGDTEPEPRDLLSEESLDDMEADLDAHPGPKISTLSEFAHQQDLLAHAMFSPGTPKPYRMSEPANIGAAVVDGGIVWRLASEARWRTDKSMAWCSWAYMADPQPYQNCTLTADDPEPPVGSVVLNEVRQVWRRELTGWETTGSNQRYNWSEIVQLNFRSGAVTLLYRGEA